MIYISPGSWLVMYYRNNLWNKHILDGTLIQGNRCLQTIAKNGHRLKSTLQWRYNGRDGVSNHQPRDCLLNCWFRRRSKKTSKLRVTGLCAGNSPGTGEFPAQMASNAEMFPFDDVIMFNHGLDKVRFAYMGNGSSKYLIHLPLDKMATVSQKIF